jgi:FtsP/CotA-like multicopper oxidase with cupredoxin domain
LLALTALALAAPAPAPAQREPEWRAAPEADIILHPFEYEPRLIRLEAGRPVKLRFVNNGRASLSFSAPGFFRAARLRRGDAASLAGGSVRLAPGERRTIALVPAPGRYPAHSANLLHRLRGMTATIVVE